MLPSGNEAQITYRVNQIQTASREQLLLITYDIGIGAIKVAKEALRDGNN
ncbi:MAG: flagellar protein FliS, partial [Acetomicrobium sp.]|nr:flagellar protein FliS [Acetomicrobium sp.]